VVSGDGGSSRQKVLQGNPFQLPTPIPKNIRNIIESKVGVSCNLATTVQYTQSALSTSHRATSNMSPNDQASKRGEDRATQEENLIRILRRAKRFFLQRNHQEALSVCNTYFSSILQQDVSGDTPQDTEDDDDETYVFIQCSIGRQQQDLFHIKVIVYPSRITDEPSSFDQLVVIALQCWEEIQKQSDDVLFLDPLIQALSLQTMTLEVFCIWVKYWQVHGLWKEACEWNLQVLTKLICANLETGTPAAVKARDELMIQCLGHQLPRVKDSNLASDILEKLLDAWSTPTMDVGTTQGDLNLYLLALTMADQPQARSIHSIQLVWDSSSTVAKDAISNKVWTQIRESWEAYGVMPSMEDEDSTDIDTENKIVPTPKNEYYSISPNTKPWKMVDGLVCWIRHQVHETIKHLTKHPQLKSQVAVSLTLTLLAWRQKGILKLILGYVLLPIKELMDALKLKD
jgi:hypothetical protein